MQRYTAHRSPGHDDDHEDDEDGGGDDNDDDQFTCHAMRTISFFKFITVVHHDMYQYEFSRLFGARTPQADQALEDAQYSMNIIPSYICHAKTVLKKNQTASRLFQIITQQILSD